MKRKFGFPELIIVLIVLIILICMFRSELVEWVSHIIKKLA